jgi:nicotinamidase-related amidase
MTLALSRSRAALLVVDIQERLVAGMQEEIAAKVIRNTQILLECAARLALPVVVSQQYPKGLGPTVSPIGEALTVLGDRVHRFDKLEFSAVETPEFAALAPALRRDQWIVVGMEAHVCVYQTARDLVARGFQAHVPVDGICSRTKQSWRVGLGLVERVGAIPTSTEVVVFDLLGRAGTDEFKALSRLIK